VKDQRTLSWRGRFIPLVDLGERLGREAMAVEDHSQPPVVVVSIGGEPVAFLVDDLQSGTDVVIKPLEGCLEGTPGITGTAVLGDGTVLLTLALEEIA
jgi:two-component system chemotaxis sensor kinase CheA